MTGFRETVRSVASLKPGDRVAGLEHFRVVQSVERMDDGSGHWSVTFQDAPASRYGAEASVIVLEVEPVTNGVDE